MITNLKMPGLVSPRTTSQSHTPTSNSLDDPKTLQSTEEQVKNFLTTCAAKSGARPIPSFSPMSSPVMAAPASRTSSNIVLDYNYGRDLSSLYVT